MDAVVSISFVNPLFSTYHSPLGLHAAVEVIKAVFAKRKLSVATRSGHFSLSVIFLV